MKRKRKKCPSAKVKNEPDNVTKATAQTESQQTNPTLDAVRPVSFWGRFGKVLGGIGALVGIVCGSLGLYAGWLAHSYSRPDMRLTLGVEFAASRKGDLPSGISNPTTLIYLVPEGITGDTIFAVPYALKNTGRRPLRNVVLRLTYHTRFMVWNEQIQALESKVVESRPDEKLLSGRDCSPLGDFTMVDHEISILRPHQTEIVCEPMRVDLSKLGQTDTSVRGSFCDRLRARVSLLAYEEVICDGASESIPFERRYFKIIWCRVPPGDPESLAQEISRKVTDAMWGGPHPEGGLYFKLPYKKRPYVYEPLECVFPAFCALSDKQKMPVSVEMPDESSRCLCSMVVPSWDYHGPVTWNIPEPLW